MVPRWKRGELRSSLNGLTETIWVRGQQGGKVFPDTPIEVGGGPRP